MEVSVLAPARADFWLCLTPNTALDPSKQDMNMIYIYFRRIFGTSLFIGESTCSKERRLQHAVSIAIVMSPVSPSGMLTSLLPIPPLKGR